MSADSQHPSGLPETAAATEIATATHAEPEYHDGFVGPLEAFIDGFRSAYAGFLGCRRRVSADLELTKTTTLREVGDEKVAVTLFRSTAAMALFAATSIAFLVMVFWVLWPLASPKEFEWMQVNSLAIAGCAVGFAIILACLDSLLVATCGAVLLFIMAHGVLFLGAMPAIRDLITHSGGAKYEVFLVVGWGIGVGLGFATGRTPFPTNNKERRSAPPWRLLVSALFAALFVVGIGLGLYQLSQLLSDKETHNAKLIGTLTALLVPIALLLSDEELCADWKKFLIPTGTLAGLGTVAGWVIDHPRLHEIEAVKGFGLGLILAATLTLTWVFLQWFVRPHCHTHRTAVVVVLLLVGIVAFVLLAFGFEHLSRENRWYLLVGFFPGVLVGWGIECLARWLAKRVST